MYSFVRCQTGEVVECVVCDNGAQPLLEEGRVVAAAAADVILGGRQGAAESAFVDDASAGRVQRARRVQAPGGASRHVGLRAMRLQALHRAEAVAPGLLAGASRAAALRRSGHEPRGEEVRLSGGSGAGS